MFRLLAHRSTKALIPLRSLRLQPVGPLRSFARRPPKTFKSNPNKAHHTPIIEERELTLEEQSQIFNEQWNKMEEEEAAKELNTEEGKERRSKYERNFFMGLCVLAAAWYGVALTIGAGHEPPVILNTFDETVSLLDSKDVKNVKDGLTVLLYGAENNNLICEKLATVENIKRIIKHALPIDPTVIANEDLHNNPELQLLSCSIIYTLTQNKKTHDVLLNQVQIQRYLIQLIESPNSTLTVKKNAALGLAELSHTRENRIILAKSGAISAMHYTLQNDLLSRHAVKKAVTLMAIDCEENGIFLTPNDNVLVTDYVYQSNIDKQSWRHQLEHPLLNNGRMLYVHTLIGGAVWALSVGLFKKVRGIPMNVSISQSVFRTAVVSGFLPAYFLGGVVTLNKTKLKEMNDYPDIFGVHCATLLGTLLPAYYINKFLHVYCPLWIGGHVVGFMSFFLSMYITDDDRLKSDQVLKAYEMKNRKKLDSVFFKIEK